MISSLFRIDMIPEIIIRREYEVIALPYPGYSFFSDLE